MTGLKPWEQDGAPDAIARLLEAARGERASEASLARSLAAASIGGMATTATATAAGATLGKLAASSPVTTKAVVGLLPAFKWLLVGAALGSAVMASVDLPREPPHPSAVQAKSPSRGTSFAPAPSKETGPLLPPATPTPTESSLAPIPPAATRTSPAGSARAAEPSRRAPALESERLAEEVRAIDEATQALNGGRAARALALLDEYDRRYPERRFAPEALYLRMDALTQLGRSGEARSVANRLVNIYPKSPQAARARALLTDPISVIETSSSWD